MLSLKLDKRSSDATQLPDEGAMREYEAYEALKRRLAASRSSEVRCRGFSDMACEHAASRIPCDAIGCACTLNMHGSADPWRDNEYSD